MKQFAQKVIIEFIGITAIAASYSVVAIFYGDRALLVGGFTTIVYMLLHMRGGER